MLYLSHTLANTLTHIGTHTATLSHIYTLIHIFARITLTRTHLSFFLFFRMQPLLVGHAAKHTHTKHTLLHTLLHTHPHTLTHSLTPTYV